MRRAIIPRRPLLVVALVCLLAGNGVSSAPGQPGGTEPWISALGQDHALTGKIWDVAGGRFIDPVTLVARLADRRFILLGEKHDNADHHRLQAWVLRGLIAAGRRSAVAFEMFDADHQPAIDRHLAAAPEDAEGLADAVDWTRSGWPAWALYRPIAEAALAARLPIAAANLSREHLKLLRQGGLGALETGLLGRLALDRPLSPESRAEITSEIRDSHCGYAPDGMVARMIDVQRARDAQLAEALIASGRAGGAVLIAGAGHVRTDYGVPAYLAARSAGASVASVAFVEVRTDAAEPAAHASRLGTGGFPFHYVWFTPRVDDIDPCEKFRKALEHLRSPGSRARPGDGPGERADD